MAHSFVQAHDDEISAFARFADANPGNVVLLIDTYETEVAAEKVVRLAPKLKQLGIDIQGVRIDSGDLGLHARKVRAILDEAGLREVRIFASAISTNISCATSSRAMLRLMLSGLARASTLHPTRRISTALTNCRNTPAAPVAS